MAVTVATPDNLTWTVNRLWLPLAARPVTPTDSIRINARPGGTSFGGAVWGNPANFAAPGLLLGLLFLIVTIPFMPVILLLRARRVTSWTLRATCRPWGRRGPKQVMHWRVRGWAESERALQEIAAAFARGDGAPNVPGAQPLV
jgi:hypothetical protein